MIRFAREDIFTSSGNPIKTIYKPKVKENGTFELVEDGEINTDDEIQSHAESCDLGVIVRRYLSGDVNALNQREGMYGDFTNLPKTYAEFLQLQINAEKTFKELPVDVRKNFDNDLNQFLATIGTEEWMKKLGIEKKVDDIVIPKTEEKEVKAE